MLSAAGVNQKLLTDNIVKRGKRQEGDRGDGEIQEKFPSSATDNDGLQREHKPVLPMTRTMQTKPAVGYSFGTGVHSAREVARDLAEVVKNCISPACCSIVIFLVSSLSSSCNCLSVNASCIILA